MNTLAVICLVVGITDGDSIKVRCGQGDQESVRLTQIDAPERGQAFGIKAKDALSGMIYGRNVELIRDGTDRYKRTLGTVHLDGRHINFEMVRQGLAWCYLEYLTDQACLALEDAAKGARRGLWSDPEPVPPWEYRKARRSKQSP